MESLRGFEYLFCGNDNIIAETIQTHLENRGIYPSFRQIKNSIELMNALKEKEWDIIFIDYSDETPFTENVMDYINGNCLLSRTILLSEDIEEEMIVNFMKKGINNFVRRDDPDAICRIVIQELSELNKVREGERLRIIRENSQKFDLIRRFAGNVSHSINNMMMVILNTTVFLSDEKGLSQQAKEDIEKIIRTGRKGQEFIRSLLMVAGGSVINPEILEINSFLSDLSENLRDMAGLGITISLEKASVSREIKGDRHLLNEAFRQIALFLKDRKGSSARIGIKGEITAFDEDDIFRKTSGLKSGEYVRVTVNGDGKGLRGDTKRHIFEPYYSESGEWRGSGLGLSVSFGIIWQHNGIIDVESSDDNGTRFYIYLPVFRKDSKEILLPRTSEYVPVSKGTVLLVEDDEEVKNILFRIFSEEGFSVIDAIDGLGALVMLQKRKPSDLVALVTDVIMPKMNGIELAREIRKKNEDVKVIFISGFPEGDTDIRTFENSIFIQKPVSKDVLMQKVRDFLSGGSRD
ncbi:MAG: response regulator [Deltaproteobacteria bacterium]|nr:response regulator [Deltaproteobacteria bacterium]